MESPNLTSGSMIARVSLVVSLAAATVIATGAAAPAEASSRGRCALDASKTTATCTYQSVSREQYFIVPAGVTSLDIVAIGGHGGHGIYVADGGVGAVVDATLAVAPGDILYVEVGGIGQSMDHSHTAGRGGWNGGGYGGQGKEDPLSGDLRTAGSGGGGASDVRTVRRASPGTLKSRLVVAAGGGGDSYVSGGDAGQAGAYDEIPGREGQPGTDTAGGAGGYDTFFGGPQAPSGAFGRGGDGWSWPWPAYFNTGAAGGGGGGGWYGGGGGQNGSGGGGGSSYTPNGSVDLAGHDDAPEVTISFRIR